KRDLWMSQAQCLKVLLADKKKRGIVDCGYRGRIVPSIEDGELRNGTPWPIDAEYLLPSASRTLENANVSRLNHIESCAWLTVAENGFTREKMSWHRTLSQKTKFRLRKP